MDRDFIGEIPIEINIRFLLFGREKGGDNFPGFSETYNWSSNLATFWIFGLYLDSLFPSLDHNVIISVPTAWIVRGGECWSLQSFSQALQSYRY